MNVYERGEIVIPDRAFEFSAHFLQVRRGIHDWNQRFVCVIVCVYVWMCRRWSEIEMVWWDLFWRRYEKLKRPGWVGFSNYFILPRFSLLPRSREIFFPLRMGPMGMCIRLFDRNFQKTIHFLNSFDVDFKKYIENAN